MATDKDSQLHTEGTRIKSPCQPSLLLFSWTIKFSSATSAWPDFASQKTQKQRAVGRSLSAILFTLFRHGGACRRAVFFSSLHAPDMKGGPIESGSWSLTLRSYSKFVKLIQWRMKQRTAKASADALTQAAARWQRRLWTSVGRDLKLGKIKVKISFWFLIEN